MADATVTEQLIEARVADLQESKDHGYSGTFNPGDSDVSQLIAAPGRITSTIGDAPVGKVTVYSTQDGEPRVINTNMLAKTLKKKLPDGKRAFVVKDPDTGMLSGPVPQYELGQVPCWFNPKSERYAEMSEVPGLKGFSCASEHLASEFDAEQHAKNRHSRRYQMAKDYLERREREEERAIRREEIAAMRALATGAAGRATKGT